MSSSTEAASQVFEETFANISKAAEANLKLQQEFFRQWTSMWPGMPAPQTAWVDKVRDFQKQWTQTVSDLARRHREAVDRQYQAALESLDSALKVTESTNPEEYRRRTEQLCRKTIDCMREVSEAQIKEFQDAMTQWSDLVTKSGS